MLNFSQDADNFPWDAFTVNSVSNICSPHYIQHDLSLNSLLLAFMYKFSESRKLMGVFVRLSTYGIERPPEIKIPTYNLERGPLSLVTTTE